MQLKRCIIYQRQNLELADLKTGRDVSWDEAMNTGRSHDCVPVDSNDPLYILYTSGTTGMPIEKMLSLFSDVTL